jgi:hypothetical protein
MPDDFEVVLELIEQDPIAGAKKCRRKKQMADQSYRQKERECMAGTIAFARKLRGSKKLFEEFKKDPFWGKREYELNPNRVLSYAFVYIYNNHKGAEADRANRHAKALQAVFEGEMPPEKIPDYIRDAGGIEDLYDAAKKKKGSVDKNHKTLQGKKDREADLSDEIDDDENGVFRNDDLEDNESDKANVSKPGHVPKTNRCEEEADKLTGSRLENKKKLTIKIEVSLEQFDAIMLLMRLGKKVSFHTEHTEVRGDWMVFDLIDFDAECGIKNLH